MTNNYAAAPDRAIRAEWATEHHENPHWHYLGRVHPYGVDKPCDLLVFVRDGVLKYTSIVEGDNPGDYRSGLEWRIPLIYSGEAKPERYHLILFHRLWEMGVICDYEGLRLGVDPSGPVPIP